MATRCLVYKDSLLGCRVWYVTVDHENFELTLDRDFASRESAVAAAESLLAMLADGNWAKGVKVEVEGA